MKKHLQLILLILLIIAAYFFYTFRLDNVPPGLYVDEATVGYNSYSILHTGKDEYGASLPVAFRFFGSYTPSLNVYLLVPLIAILDLSVFSVRLFSVLCGLIMIFVIYTFIKNLNLTINNWTPFIGALIFTITPYTFFYARIGYEVFLGFTLFSLGVLFSLLSLKNQKLLIPALLLLSLSTYATHLQKYLVPLFVIVYLLTFRTIIFKKVNLKYLITAFILSALIQIPNLSFVLSPAFLIKSDLFYIQAIEKNASVLSNYMPQPIAFTISTLREFVSQYVTYFSPRSLFFSPDPDPQRSLPDLSIFYSWMVIPYFVGLFMLWKNRTTISGKFLIILLLISPIPAALTKDPFTTQRGLATLLPLSLVIILGIDFIINHLKPKVWIPFGLIVLIISLIFLYRSYFILLPLERAQTWNMGFEQLAQFIKSHPQNNFIIDQYNSKPAYIELAFFLKYPPEKFQEELLDQTIKDNYYTNTKWNYNYHFGNITTRLIDFNQDLCQGNILVGSETTFSPNDIKNYNLRKVIDIKDPLKNQVFVGYEVGDNAKCKD